MTQTTKDAKPLPTNEALWEKIAGAATDWATAFAVMQVDRRPTTGRKEEAKYKAFMARLRAVIKEYR